MTHSPRVRRVGTRATRRLSLRGLAATRALGEALGARLRAGDVLALVGPLGAGKTTLVRAIVAGLGGDPRTVTSPTFVLVNRYAGRIPLVHVDAYRLAGAEEFRSLGHEELFPERAAAAVEWGDRVGEALPPGTVTVRISATGRSTRRVEISGPAGRVRDLCGDSRAKSRRNPSGR